MLQHLGPCIPVGIELHTFDVGELQSEGLPIPAPIQTLALVDTGASMSVVHPSIMNALNPTIYARTPMRGVHNEEPRRCPTFRAIVTFPGSTMGPFATEVVADAFTSKESDVRVILGRTFLRDRRFLYEGRNGRIVIVDEDG